jgi:hypothetical protein
MMNPTHSARSDHFFPLHQKKKKKLFEQREHKKGTSRGEQRSEWAEPEGTKNR